MDADEALTCSFDLLLDAHAMFYMIDTRVLSKGVPHPQFLCEGLEEDVASRKAGLTGAELLTAASGKMLLLHKLLPKLRREGHKARRPHVTFNLPLLLPCGRHIAALLHHCIASMTPSAQRNLASTDKRRWAYHLLLRASCNCLQQVTDHTPAVSGAAAHSDAVRA